MRGRIDEAILGPAIGAWLAIQASACVQSQPCPACPACPACTACAEDDGEEEATRARWFVVRAKDGDTLVARLEGGPTERTETIRLLNVDTPEAGAPGFEEAAEALKELVRGGYVDLEFERPRVEKRDGFGRLLAYVIADGANVNVELVRRGWSRLYTKYGKGRLHALFAAAEAEARAAGRGLWGLDEAQVTSPGTR